MFKLIAQAFFSLLISLGLVTGANPNVRGEVKQTWQEAKAIVHQTVDFAVDTASDLIAQVNNNVNVEASTEANAKTNTDVYFGEGSNQVQAGVDSQAEASYETQPEDGLFLNFGGDANAGLNIGLGLGK
ncbi:MAG: hypothetical protein ACYC6R_09040 [Anaerolineales bacterium]